MSEKTIVNPQAKALIYLKSTFRTPVDDSTSLSYCCFHSQHFQCTKEKKSTVILFLFSFSVASFAHTIFQWAKQKKIDISYLHINDDVIISEDVNYVFSLFSLARLVPLMMYVYVTSMFELS